MAAEKINGVWVVYLDETDQSLGGMDYAAGELFKMDVSGTGVTALAMTVSGTAGGNPLDEYEPASTDEDGVEQFRIPDDGELGEHVAEGETIQVNLWTGPSNDPRRRAYGTIKRKVSIRRLSEAPEIIVFETGVYEAGVFV